MRILIVLLILLVACATPTKVVTTYETDSITGRTKKIVTKYYDTVRTVREHYYSPNPPNIWFHNYWPDYWWWNRPYYAPRYYVVPKRPNNPPPPPPPIRRIPSPRH